MRAPPNLASSSVVYIQNGSAAHAPFFGAQNCAPPRHPLPSLAGISCNILAAQIPASNVNTENYSKWNWSGYVRHYGGGRVSPWGDASYFALVFKPPGCKMPLRDDASYTAKKSAV